MSKYLSPARREAFQAVPETCPEVDKAVEKIKEQTGNLREALVDALCRALEAEDKVLELESKIEKLEDQIADLEMERA